MTDTVLATTTILSPDARAAVHRAADHYRGPRMLKPNAPVLRRVARALGLEHIITRVSSGKRVAYVWLDSDHARTPAAYTLTEAYRLLWADGANRVRYTGVAGIAIGRADALDVPAMPEPDDAALVAALAPATTPVPLGHVWAELVHARRECGDGLYLADADIVRALVEAGLAEVPADVAARGALYAAYGEVLTEAGRALVAGIEVRPAVAL
jgi:hypothetical protein